MSGRPEAVLLGDACLDVLYFPTLGLQHLSALETDEVHGLLREPVLVPLESLAEIVFHHQSGSNQKIESPVQCRLSDLGTVLPEAILDLVHRKVFGGCEHDIGDGLPLPGYRKAVVLEISSKKPLTGDRLDHELRSGFLRRNHRLLRLVQLQEIPEPIRIPMDLNFLGDT